MSTPQLRREIVPSGGGPAAARRVVPGTARRILAAIDHSVVHVFLAIVGLVWLLPTVGLLVTSFRPRSDIQSTGWWDLIHLRLTLVNYEEVLQSQGILQAFVNTLIIAIPSTLLPLGLCAMAAYAFAWMRFPLRDSIFLFVIALMIVPVQVAFIPVLTMFREVVPQLQLTRGYWAIWLVHAAFALPFGIFLLRNFFVTLPTEMIEASRIDGASEARIFRSIVLPLTIPALAAYGILQFLWVWNDLLMALVFVQDPSKVPLTRSIQNMLGQYGTEWNILSSGAFILMLVPLVVFFSLQRYFVRGLLAGSIK